MERRGQRDNELLNVGINIGRENGLIGRWMTRKTNIRGIWEERMEKVGLT